MHQEMRQEEPKGADCGWASLEAEEVANGCTVTGKAIDIGRGWGD